IADDVVGLAIARRAVLERRVPRILEFGILRIRPQPADTAAGLGHQLVERGRQRAGIHLELAHLVGDCLDLGTRQVDARAVAAAEDAGGRERDDAADQHHHQDDLDQAEAALRTAERLAVNDAVATADTSESPAPGAVPLRTAGRLAENDAVATAGTSGKPKAPARS